MSHSSDARFSQVKRNTGAGGRSICLDLCQITQSGNFIRLAS
jgi:hypothetical protein